ncbi:hypothetical protein [Rhodococcus pyridinivorans]|uniref:Phage associated protein n=1 Tax=Rhodococcus pyridinivorans AK37 TaxID=1114960 RepID=H0JL59_9NOCA|nr:hypothetical protein [Rhodococcus pyridinivorans]EHK86394.1 phage associated protein [Rhodococcus pyridinivorans AK37]MCD2139515.1 hypothetical protein [Rhodococcus pyridinivorans]
MTAAGATIERTTSSPTYEDWPTLTGRQKPHHLLEQAGDHALGEKALTLAARAGSRSMPWQRDAQLAILAKRPDGMWTHPLCVIICPRQNGKSEILIVRVLFGLFKLGENIIYTAQRWTTAEDIYLRIWALIEGQPSLLRNVVKHTCSQGRGTIHLKNGGKVVFTTRSADAGRGFTKLDLIIYDEAYSLTDGEMSALAPLKMAADDPQTIFASSAVNEAQHPDGFVLSGMRELGLSGEPDDVYFSEFMAPEEMDRDSEDTWRYASPSYGVIQTAAKIRNTQRELGVTAGGKISFDVEILGRGRWPTDLSGERFEPVIDLDAWRDHVVAEPELDFDDFAVSFDMPEDRSVLTIGAATRRVDGGIHYEVVFHGKARDAVETLTKVNEKNPRAVCVSRSSPAMSIVPDLEDAGVEIVLVNEQQQAQANGALVDELAADLTSHTGDELFESALQVAEKRSAGAGGAWTWDRKTGSVISPMVCVSLARFGMWAEVEQAPAESKYETEDLFIV